MTCTVFAGQLTVVRFELRWLQTKRRDSLVNSSSTLLTHPTTHSPIHPPTHPPTHPLTDPPTHSLIRLLTYHPYNSYTHSPTHISTHSFIHALTHPTIHAPPIHPSTHSPIIRSLTHPNNHPSTHSSTHSSIHPPTHSCTNSSSGILRTQELSVENTMLTKRTPLAYPPTHPSTNSRIWGTADAEIKVPLCWGLWNMSGYRASLATATVRNFLFVLISTLLVHSSSFSPDPRPTF